MSGSHIGLFELSADNRSTYLTRGRHKFVEAYLETGNASVSAAQTGYSERFALVTGSGLLRNDKVAVAIEIETKTPELKRTGYSPSPSYDLNARVAFSGTCGSITD